ncbi:MULTISPECIES: hypothetical protein [unclassified Streptomyces]|uniref:hypothetical protein n=1 Tax=unclassified Streptomyces TaxID=2593676 RepID=UPI001BE7A80A|nr:MULTISPECIES: hypothetical protein [unclassified Streptomyces]MBT2403319.1 hypothetical protein [Streptomyces sp. ISL-21]MBT2459641.1 hypothetical protein [Streptomyces sp. ISL-86]MBT2613576.1 hypothetical protein [Streptomyces sp. ISL-87]
MTQANATWRLMRQDTLLGTITVEEADFPWLSGGFRPEPAFAQVKPWFDEALAAMETEAFGERFDAAYDRIARALTLVSPSGPVAEFLLHVDGDVAWFRWNDESDEG